MVLGKSRHNNVRHLHFERQLWIWRQRNFEGNFWCFGGCRRRRSHLRTQWFPINIFHHNIVESKWTVYLSLLGIIFYINYLQNCTLCLLSTQIDSDQWTIHFHSDEMCTRQVIWWYSQHMITHMWTIFGDVSNAACLTAKCQYLFGQVSMLLDTSTVRALYPFSSFVKCVRVRVCVCVYKNRSAVFLWWY